uniref:Uncharacterized protein n=1 Tax=viral metagenome TaxID=1070528 RepID=A0A6C0D524_9ZZZZ
MNLLLDINKVSIKNFYYLDTKKNVIIDGNFTKMIYSNENFSMNGSYFEFPIEINHLEKYGNKTTILFNPQSKTNSHIIQNFSKLEAAIIDYYRQNHQSNSKIVHTLAKQLNSGSIKIYKEYNYSNIEHVENEAIDISNITCILKISGIWETVNEIGLTFKLFRV